MKRDKESRVAHLVVAKKLVDGDGLGDGDERQRCECEAEHEVATGTGSGFEDAHV